VRRALGTGGIYAILGVVTAFALIPTFWIIVSSFKTGAQIYSGGSIVPHPFTVQGYRDVFSQIKLHRYLVNTLIFAGGGTLGALATGALAAYPLARYRFRSRGLLTAVFSLGLAIPAVGLIVPEFFIVRELHLFDRKLGLVLFYSALFFPLSFVILRSYFASLPIELEEAAIVEGAGYFTIFWKLILPLAVPGLVTVGVVVFIAIWNEYLFAQLLTISFDNQNAQVALATFRSQFGFNVTATLAGATLVMAVPIAAFLFLQRYVIAGLSAGSAR
jgi:raffinose/stachyose/melibiose transport system permease protein